MSKEQPRHRRFSLTHRQHSLWALPAFGLVLVAALWAATLLLVPFNIAAREFFRLHAERDTGLLDISKPVIGRASGLSIILLSRRMNHADGSFAGS